MSQNKDQVIAIDGPSGSGKSTMAQVLAKKLDLLYVDTGAMFRALGLGLSLLDIPFKETDELEAALRKLNFQYGNSEDDLVSIRGENVTAKIREHYVSDLAGKVAKLPTVRTYLLDIQRALVKDRVCVMEGRDIGTIVFPNAFCKIFYTASIDVRADRRHLQLIEKGNTNISLEQVILDVKARDKRDTEREVAPLAQAEDATLLLTDELDQAEALLKMIEIVNEKAQESGISL